MDFTSLDISSNTKTFHASNSEKFLRLLPVFATTTPDRGSVEQPLHDPGRRISRQCLVPFCTTVPPLCTWPASQATATVDWGKGQWSTTSDKRFTDQCGPFENSEKELDPHLMLKQPRLITEVRRNLWMVRTQLSFSNLNSSGVQRFRLVVLPLECEGKTR